MLHEVNTKKDLNDHWRPKPKKKLLKKVSQNLFIDSSTRELVNELTLDECIGLISGRRGLHSAIPWIYRFADYPTRGVARFGIPPIRFTDGPKGVNLGRATCFPVALARGASWDADLEYKIGVAMAKEAVAQGANALGSTCLNIIRHPGWGRSQETYSADSKLLSTMGAALVTGIQSQRVIAVVKHYACNSIENSRFKVNVIIDERALHEVYLPHFKACVDAGAAAFMSAYNRVNGEYCGENKVLLNDILRERFGFKGFVMSDFLLGTRSTAKALNAGLDIEMPQTWYFSRRSIRKAIKCGELEESTVRRAANRVILQLNRFGLLDSNQKRPPISIVGYKAHQQLALESARRSIVLLKNDGMLPFKGIRSLAVIGQLAKHSNLGSEGSTSVKPPFTITLWKGLHQHLRNIKLHFDSGRNPHRAVALAGRCDAALIAAGLKGSDEGEYFLALAGGDRRRLELPDRQIQIIEAVANKNPNTGVVLFGGSAIACGEWRNKISAMMMAWYPGMMGGLAIAEILAGTINPSGRLPLSFPVRTEDLPLFEPEADKVTYDLWHDYRWLDRQCILPAYSFGHGLGYSKIVYQNIATSVKAGDIHLQISVKNTGQYDASEVIQIYLAGDAPGGERVSKELKLFCRENIPAGTERSIELTLPSANLAWFNPELGDWVLEPGRYRLLCGPGVTCLPLEANVILS